MDNWRGGASATTGAHMPSPRYMLASEGGRGTKDSSHVTTSKTIGHGCLYLKKMLTTAAPIDQSQVVLVHSNNRPTNPPIAPPVEATRARPRELAPRTYLHSARNVRARAMNSLSVDSDNRRELRDFAGRKVADISAGQSTNHQRERRIVSRRHCCVALLRTHWARLRASIFMLVCSLRDGIRWRVRGHRTRPPVAMAHCGGRRDGGTDVMSKVRAALCGFL